MKPKRRRYRVVVVGDGDGDTEEPARPRKRRRWLPRVRRGTMQRLVVAVIVCVLVAVFAGWLWAVRAALLLVVFWLFLRLAAKAQRSVKKNIKRRLQT